MLCRFCGQAPSGHTRTQAQYTGARTQGDRSMPRPISLIVRGTGGRPGQRNSADPARDVQGGLTLGAVENRRTGYTAPQQEPSHSDMKAAVRCSSLLGVCRGGREPAGHHRALGARRWVAQDRLEPPEGHQGQNTWGGACVACGHHRGAEDGCMPDCPLTSRTCSGGDSREHRVSSGCAASPPLVALGTLAAAGSCAADSGPCRGAGAARHRALGLRIALFSQHHGCSGPGHRE